MDYRQTLAPGTTLLDQYRIVRVLGVGGFGITYMARDTGLDVEVAIKEYFPAEFGMRDPSLTVRPATSNQAPVFDQCRASFVREARTLAQFRHPSIVRVLRVFEANGTAYTVMEYVEGQSLASWAESLRRRPRQSELDGILRPLMAALDELHAASFIHRDIAPDNVLIRKDGSPVLIDFGATRQVLAAVSRNFTGIVKQGYSPPEQYAMDAKLQGPWTDVYALGGILYWLVTGEKPVPAPERQLGIAMPPAALSAGGYRRSFLEGIDRALAIPPGDRPQSLTELGRYLLPPERPARDESTVRPDTRTEQIQPRSWQPGRFGDARLRHGGAGLARQLRVALPMLAAALVGGVLIWQAGGIGAGGNPPAATTTPIDPQGGMERQRLAAADAQRRAEAERAEAERQRREAERIEAEKKAADDRRQADAERQRRESEQQTAAQKKAEDERKEAAARADAERLRREAEQRAAAEKQAEGQRRQATETERQRIAAEARAAEETRVLVADIRRELDRLGCASRGIAPGWTDDDQQALQRFVRTSGGTLSFPELNREIVRVLQGFRQRVCISCAAGEFDVDGRCVPTSLRPGAPSAAELCRQINERAQLGLLTDEDREQLRRLSCR